jgi:Fic family protein
MNRLEPYIPGKLPLDNLDWLKFINLIGKANFALAQYAGILQGMVNPALLLSPLTTKEAVISSRIEGTQATFEDVLKYEASPGKTSPKTEDILEIINYRRTLEYAIEFLKVKPSCLNLCKDMHNILLDSVRGRDKSRGEFRTTQNWIGSPGSPIEKATYIPPPPDRLIELLDNFEKYLHSEEKDNLVQLAIIHAQFEIIHPFLDGNGRLGRILVPIILVEKEMLNAPVFYISEYIDDNRDEYYDRLHGITKNNDWESWIEFFLITIIEQSKANSIKAKAILSLYNSMKEEIERTLHSQYSIRTLDTIFQNPIFNTTIFSLKSGIPKASASRILTILNSHKIVDTIYKGKGKRPSLIVFDQLWDIIK